MNYIEEDEESKEIEKLNKYIEKNLKLEININKNLEEADNFVKDNKWGIIGDRTYHFYQNIERIWDIIKSLDSLIIINKSEHYPFIIKKGSNIWNLGNIFEGKLFDIYEFNAKVIKQKLFTEVKKIEWIFFLENGENFRLKCKLYKVTEDNSTVLNIIIKHITNSEEIFIPKIKEQFNQIDYTNKIEEMIKKESIYLYQYESGIIPSNMEEIWEIVTDCSKLVLVAPNNKCFVPININNAKIGDILNVPMKIKNCDGFLQIKLDLKEKKLGWNKWCFAYSILGGEPYKISRQTILVQLTKINKNETQLSMFTNIYEKIPMEMYKCLSRQKKYVISSIKDYFENFSSNQKDI